MPSLDLLERPAALGFLAGGGEMGALIRAHDWAATTLGPPADWPQPLRTTVRLLLNTGHPMYIWWGPEGLCLHNDAYRRSIGPERHPGSLGRPARIVWDEIWDIVGPQYDAVMAGAGSSWSENRLVPITRSGRREDVYWTYSYGPIDDASAPGGIGGVLVICAETTRAVLAERRLADQVARQRRQFDGAPGFVAILNGPDHVFEFVNDAYARLAGPRDYLGHAIRDVLPDLDGQRFFDLLDGVYRTGERITLEHLPVSFARPGAPGREERFVSFVYEPVSGDDGTVAGIFVQGIDVTDAHRSIAALRESEEFTRRVLESSNDCIKVLELDGTLAFMNEGGRRLMEIADFDALKGHCWTDFWAGPGAEQAAAALDAARAGGVGRFQGPADTAAGNPRHWDVCVTAILGSDGRPERLLAVSRDITDQRRLEDGLRRSNETLEDRVRERTEALEHAQDALRQSQKLEAIGQLTGGVAHDFNNLLTVIRGSIDLLRRPGLREERRVRYMEAISETVTRAAKLTGQLLAFARRQTLQPEVFDVGENIAALAGMIGTLTGSRIVARTKLPGEPCCTNADPSQFDTALVNMAVNARDAMAGEGTLLIRVRAVDGIPPLRSYPGAPGRFVAVAIVDTGPGIAEADLDRIFEPFFTTKGVGHGTGLGLSQVFGFAKQTGGEVLVESRPGHGTTFTLYLPASADPPAVRTVEPEGALAAGHGTRVLVVEDNRDVGAFAASTLEELGYRATLAVDGRSALAELAADDGYDVVFSDVVMPGMSGVELGQEIRRLHADLPVVLTSGYSHVLAENGTHGFELLHKPYSMEELSRVLRKAAAWRCRQTAAA
jgi:PAS domain S-box-containing protein